MSSEWYSKEEAQKLCDRFMEVRNDEFFVDFMHRHLNLAFQKGQQLAGWGSGPDDDWSLGEDYLQHVGFECFSDEDIDHYWRLEMIVCCFADGGNAQLSVETPNGFHEVSVAACRRDLRKLVAGLNIDIRDWVGTVPSKSSSGNQ